jgi:hypothetical protein
MFACKYRFVFGEYNPRSTLLVMPSIGLFSFSHGDIATPPRGVKTSCQLAGAVPLVT